MSPTAYAYMATSIMLPFDLVLLFSSLKGLLFPSLFCIEGWETLFLLVACLVTKPVNPTDFIHVNNQTCRISYELVHDTSRIIVRVWICSNYKFCQNIMSLPANEGDHNAGRLHGTGSLALAQISCVNGPGRWSNLQIILNVTLQRSQQPAIMLHHIMLEHHHASLGSFPMIPKFPISSSPWHAWRRSCLVMDHVQ